jgi:hypothetical protein
LQSTRGIVRAVEMDTLFSYRPSYKLLAERLG